MVGGFVNGVGLPAVPDDVEPGAGEDACGVGVIVSAGSGAVVKSGRPLKKSEIPNDVYEAELFRLQTEFVKLQEWVRLMAGRASPRAGRRIRRLHPRHRPRRLPCDARQSRRADCGSRSGRRSRRGHHVELVAIDGCHPRIRRRRRAGGVVPAGRPLPADQAGESSALLIARRVRSAYARVRLSPSDPTRHPTPPPAQRRGVRHRPRRSAAQLHVSAATPMLLGYDGQPDGVADASVGSRRPPRGRRSAHRRRRPNGRRRWRMAPVGRPGQVGPTRGASWARPCHSIRSSAGPFFHAASSTSCALNAKPRSSRSWAYARVSAGGSSRSSGMRKTPSLPCGRGRPRASRGRVLRGRPDSSRSRSAICPSWQGNRDPHPISFRSGQKA